MTGKHRELGSRERASVRYHAHISSRTSHCQRGGFDWQIIMGCPMNIYREDEFPWLFRDGLFIKGVIDTGKIVLGICLGAQMRASVLGARIRRNRYPEIGWFEVGFTDEAQESQGFRHFPKRSKTFHWHGDTFDLPSSCKWVAQSGACKNQAFEYDGMVIGLQSPLNRCEHFQNTWSAFPFLSRFYRTDI
ncbi:MAG: type 1 glutamine amidotransferase [Euryarchaeota archaeon]|nr:type 1 glutamine amidotransferase [Euryarchaeota archaeon]